MAFGQERLARATGLLPLADRFTRAATEDASLGLVPKRLVFRRPLPRAHGRLSSALRVTPSTRTALAQAPLYVFDQRVHSVFYRHVWLPRAPGPEARRTEFHAKAHGYHVGAPEMRELLEWCPKDGTRIVPGTLPWVKE
ncbi:hypothetical protein EDB85DRAFT_2148579 [Lactarius pseudohatsudake]|nr:hypothetical protein EDB85DRAFT_2148579 [Lactarius pseudohatsudake]